MYISNKYVSDDWRAKSYCVRRIAICNNNNNNNGNSINAKGWMKKNWRSKTEQNEQNRRRRRKSPRIVSCDGQRCTNYKCRVQGRARHACAFGPRFAVVIVVADVVFRFGGGIGGRRQCGSLLQRSERLRHTSSATRTTGAALQPADASMIIL